MMAAARRMRMLVVEDEPLVAMMIEDVVAEMDCDIVGPVAQIDEAVAVAKLAEVDCALLDVNIQGGTIEPVAAILKARGVPVLLATGYGSNNIPEVLRNYPCLAKPYSTGRLREAVRDLRARVDGAINLVGRPAVSDTDKA
jgi:DNA-binding response OmpR family regulator